MTKANDYEAWAADRQERLKSNQLIPHRYVEKPAMEKLLPDLKGKKVLMVGCGTGEESELLTRLGATDITGIDSSQESIRLAKESYPDVSFMVGDMHHLEFEDKTFDFVYSSLTIHYSETPNKVYEEIYRVLKPAGQFLFSVTHPIRWASERIVIDGITTKVTGYAEDQDNPRWYGNYSSVNHQTETFPNGEVLQFWVAPPSLHFSMLRTVGFSVDAFVETQAIEELRDVDLFYYQRAHEYPQFSIFLARKPD